MKDCYMQISDIFGKSYCIFHFRPLDPMDCSPPSSSVHEILQARILEWAGKNTGVGCHALLQGIFPTQGSNLVLPHCRQMLYRLSHQGSQMVICSISDHVRWHCRNWQPTPVFLPGEFHGQRSLVGYSPWCCKESDTTERRSHNKAFVGNKRQWVLQAIAVWCPKQV